MANYFYEVMRFNDNFKMNDYFKDWISAKSVYEARQIIEKAYPKELGYKCNILSENATSK